MAVNFTKSTNAINTNLPDNNSQLITASKLRETLNTIISDATTSIESTGSDQIPYIQQQINGINNDVKRIDYALTSYVIQFTDDINELYGYTDRFDTSIRNLEQMDVQLNSTVQNNTITVQNVNRRLGETETKLRITDEWEKYYVPVILTVNYSSLSNGSGRFSSDSEFYKLANSGMKLISGQYCSFKVKFVNSRGDEFMYSPIWNSDNQMCLYGYSDGKGDSYSMIIGNMQANGNFSYVGNLPEGEYSGL